MYSDDVDLSYRMLLKGKSNYYYPETTVIHYKGESTVKDGIYMKRFQESMQFFYKKALKVSVSFRFYEKRDLVFSFVKCVSGSSQRKDT
jgi:GT2 family glycosyltransferase